MWKVTLNMPVCPLLCPIGVHSFTGKEQWSHSFPDEHFDQGPQGFFHWRKVQDLHGMCMLTLFAKQRIYGLIALLCMMQMHNLWSEYVQYVCLSTECMYTFFPLFFHRLPWCLQAWLHVNTQWTHYVTLTGLYLAYKVYFPLCNTDFFFS